MGDTGFLIDDGTTAVLVDTGYGFTGKAMARNIKKYLGDRRLDYILLTHSHYDHVLGVPHVLQQYPRAKVVAGTYASSVFQRPSALKLMYEMDCKAAGYMGVAPSEDLTDTLHADIVVEDGQTLTCGDMVFQVIELPGHTKCSVGFYLASHKLLVSTETLGVCDGEDGYMPSFLVGYQMALDSFQKVKPLPIDTLLVPHLGVVEGEKVADCLEGCEQATREMARCILAMFRDGKTKEEILAYLKERDYDERVQRGYPISAFLLNTGIMIDRVRQELFDPAP
jgi:glyoxylase-like metal-dependent hydrolase (beta-lactamase superfamily II)